VELTAVITAGSFYVLYVVKQKTDALSLIHRLAICQTGENVNAATYCFVYTRVDVPMPPMSARDRDRDAGQRAGPGAE
jgi:hypothetical protein